MSLIMHRCTACRHPDFFHDTAIGDCSYGHCSAGRHTFTPGPSETMVTYTPAGEFVRQCTPPGTRHTAFGRGGFDTCSCRQCWRLYRQRDEAS